MDFFNICTIVSLSMYIFAGEEALLSWLLLTGVYVVVDSIEGRVAIMVVPALIAALLFYIGQPIVGFWCVVSVLFNGVLGHFEKMTYRM